MNELAAIFLEVVDHWNDLLAFLVESREGIDLTTYSGSSVEVDLAGDRTLRARFALMSTVMKIS